MPEEGQAEIQPRGNFFQRLFRRVSKRPITSEDRGKFEAASEGEEDPWMVHHEKVKRIWEQHFSGKVPRSWSVWYGAERDFEKGGSKDSVLIEAAVLHHHCAVGTAAGVSQKLSSEHLAVIIYRDDFPDWAKEEVYEVQGQMGVTTGEFKKAQECAERFAKGVNAKEDGSQAVAFLPPTRGDVSLARVQERTSLHPQQVREAVQPREAVEKISPEELINEALDRLGLERKLRPKIFYAQTLEEFKAKVDEHFEKAGVPPKAVNLRACYYSGVLKECIIHPEVVRRLETVGIDLDAFNHLMHFEYVIHEVLHGVYDLLTEDSFDIPVEIGSGEELYDFYTGTLKPLEGYMVSIVAHDVVIQLKDKIAGDIHPGLLEGFIKQSRVSSLDSFQEKHFGQIFGRLVSEDDSEKARFFAEKWKTPEGVNEVLGQYLQAKGQ